MNDARTIQARFSFDDGVEFIGLTDGSTWNGWGNPWFDRETLGRIAQHLVDIDGDLRLLVPDDEDGDLTVLDHDAGTGEVVNAYHAERMTFNGVRYWFLGQGYCWWQHDESDGPLRDHPSDDEFIEV